MDLQTLVNITQNFRNDTCKTSASSFSDRNVLTMRFEKPFVRDFFLARPFSASVLELRGMARPLFKLTSEKDE